jgi:hypothetical protein
METAKDILTQHHQKLWLWVRAHKSIFFSKILDRSPDTLMYAGNLALVLYGIMQAAKNKVPLFRELVGSKK